MIRLPAPTPDTPTLDELRAALQKAEPDTPARWGRMDCPQMLKHCREFVDLYMGRLPVSWAVRVLARAFGSAFLRKTLSASPAKTPRNLRTLPQLRASTQDRPSFDAERDALLTALGEVERLSGTVRHPLYGPMEAADLVALVRHHTAHHAHQFGLWEPARGRP